MRRREGFESWKYAFKALFRFGVTTSLVIGKSEIQQKLRVIGLDRQRLVVLRDGLVEEAFVRERSAIIPEALDRFRMPLQIFAIKRQGGAEIARLMGAQSLGEPPIRLLRKSRNDQKRKDRLRPDSSNS